MLLTPGHLMGPVFSCLIQKVELQDNLQMCYWHKRNYTHSCHPDSTIKSLIMATRTLQKYTPPQLLALQHVAMVPKQLLIPELLSLSPSPPRCLTRPAVPPHSVPRLLHICRLQVTAAMWTQESVCLCKYLLVPQWVSWGKCHSVWQNNIWADSWNSSPPTPSHPPCNHCNLKETSLTVIPLPRQHHQEEDPRSL